MDGGSEIFWVVVVLCKKNVTQSLLRVYWILDRNRKRTWVTLAFGFAGSA